MMYGLIGEKLSHSFSKDIHELFGNTNYHIFEIEKIEDFLSIDNLAGFNITIPYKNQIIKYLDEIDEVSENTGSVNTVLRKKDKLYGYNTDYYGFIETINYHHLVLKNKKVLILGNGSVSNTVIYALKNLDAKLIKRLARNVKSKDDDNFLNYSHFLDAEVIINTTPVGMYPNNEDELLIPIDEFKNLEVVIDLVYNPLKTKLLLKAEENKVKIVNGLYMLVMQAKRAHELFFSCEIPLNLANKVYKKIIKKLYNIVFIGLPLSGKSKYTRILETKLNKKAYDTDEEIEKIIGMTIFDYFSTHTESEFRVVETSIIKQIFKNHNLIISTGGGAVKTPINISLLKQNGVIIFLDKDPDKIAKKIINGRPLIKKSSDIYAIAEERLPLYKKYCDIRIALNYDTVYHINEIKEKIDEYFGY